jgi:hypothetical protein
MATRTVNLRLPEDLVEYLKRNNDSINQAVISEINTLKRIRTVALGELKGIFTPQEWIFFADVFNSVRVEDVFRTNVGVLIATCEDAERFENTATNHRVDMPILIDKIGLLVADHRISDLSHAIGRYGRQDIELHLTSVHQ